MKMDQDLFRGFGVEIDILNESNFLKIKETLSRIGIASKKDKTLFQSVHILHKRGQYSLMSFKELFAFDGRENTIEEEDISRRNTIAILLEEWNLLRVLNKPAIENNLIPMAKLKILSFAEKQTWTLSKKYNL